MPRIAFPAQGVHLEESGLQQMKTLAGPRQRAKVKPCIISTPR
jgi:hypothetical protein